ncbi:MAG: hypothetical protein ACTSRG_00780 [Candidatus Helarchaeota archaeon]
MDKIQQNIIFFNIIGIGLIIIGLFLFLNVFDEYKFFNFLIAFVELDVSAPAPFLGGFFILSFPPIFEFYSNILILQGICVLIATILYLFLKKFDWVELWMKYSMLSLIMGLVFVVVGFIVILFKRYLIPIYVLLTLALNPFGYISFLSAPYNIIDAIIISGMGISMLFLVFIWIYRYPSYQ